VNKEIYDDSVEFPVDKREHMKRNFHKVKGANENTEGFKRNQELQSQYTITYKQLKRIKNFFDNFKGNHKDPSYILNGGIEMKHWVDTQLRQMREGIHMTKNNKSETGMQNQHIKPHEKTFGNVRHSQEHLKTVDKYNTAVTESLKRINELISKI
jgi:hypothetical protein